MRGRAIILAACTTLLCVPGSVRADHSCTIAGIAIVAGAWETTAEVTAYAVQAQDASGEVCHAAETLRLDFATSGEGAFEGKTSPDVQEWISTGSANRNFYYRNPSGEAHTLTVRAGYGDTGEAGVDWTVEFETTHTTDAAPAAGGTDDDATGDDGESTDTEEESEDAAANAEIESTNGNIDRVRLFADDSLEVAIVHHERGFVGQPMRFTAIPDGLEQTKLRTLSYRWSFGDGMTAEARSPLHTYERAGTYVAVVVASRAGHEAAARATITVLPLSLSLSRDDDGVMLVHNDARYEADVSGLALSDGAETFTLPEHTYLSARGTLALPPERTGFAVRPARVVALRTSGEVLAQYPPQEPPQRTLVAAPAAAPLEIATTTPTPLEQDASPRSPAMASSTVAATTTPAGEAAIDRGRYATVAFAGLMAVSVLALYALRLS